MVSDLQNTSKKQTKIWELHVETPPKSWYLCENHPPYNTLQLKEATGSEFVLQGLPFKSQECLFPFSFQAGEWEKTEATLMYRLQSNSKTVAVTARWWFYTRPKVIKRTEALRLMELWATDKPITGSYWHWFQLWNMLKAQSTFTTVLIIHCSS